MTCLSVSPLVKVAKASAKRIAACTTSEKLQACSRCASGIRARRRGCSLGTFGARAADVGSAVAEAASDPRPDPPSTPFADADGDPPAAGVAVAPASAVPDPVVGNPFPPRGLPYPTITGAASIVAAE